MKKGKKVNLSMNKVRVSKLNHIRGGNGSGCSGPSVDELCVITTELITLPINCKTGITLTNDTEDFCIQIGSVKC